MPETTVAMPLSGEEVMDAIADEVRRVLIRNCHLNPALAYAAFTAEIYVKLKLKDNGREPEIEAEVHAHAGNQQSLKEMEPMEAHAQMEDRPPNAVRQRAGIGIPTLIEDSQGRREVRPVSYRRAERGPGGTQEQPPKPAPKPEHPPHEPQHPKPEHEPEKK